MLEINSWRCRSADKRQAMAERDILHAMAHSAPHPFTTGLKFAFQSANNLYLGMEYLQGGNLKQLIQRFKTLPEVGGGCGASQHRYVLIALCLVSFAGMGALLCSRAGAGSGTYALHASSVQVRDCPGHMLRHASMVLCVIT